MHFRLQKKKKILNVFKEKINLSKAKMLKITKTEFTTLLISEFFFVINRYSKIEKLIYYNIITKIYKFFMDQY